MRLVAVDKFTVFGKSHNAYILKRTDTNLHKVLSENSWKEILVGGKQ